MQCWRHHCHNRIYNSNNFLGWKRKPYNCYLLLLANEKHITRPVIKNLQRTNTMNKRKCCKKQKKVFTLSLNIVYLQRTIFCWSSVNDVTHISFKHDKVFMKKNQQPSSSIARRHLWKMTFYFYNTLKISVGHKAF